MSKYTKDDADIASLEEGDRINFEFDMLNHEVDKNVELSYGVTAAVNPGALLNILTDWRKIGISLLMFACGILFICTIVLVCAYLILLCFGEKKKIERDMLKNVTVSCILFIAIIVILYLLFNNMLGETKTLITLTKENFKDKINLKIN